jgi:transposase-like protein
MMMNQCIGDRMYCPQCKSDNFCKIIYGYVDINDEIQNKINQKKIVLGGYIVTDCDPKWKCSDCDFKWGERDD